MSIDAKIPAGRRMHAALRNGVSAVAVALCLASGGAAAAPTYTIFDVSGSLATAPAAINAGGSVTGFYVDPSDIFHGFVRAADGTITPFDPKASTFTNPSGINTKGAIVGYYNDAGGGSHGFLRKPSGKITRIDPKGSVETTAVSINAGGSIAGSY
jgi:hypothetical protein